MSDMSQIEHKVACAMQEISAAHSAPHAYLRAKVFPDGDQWCCLYGKNLQDGVCGFGETPHLAVIDFDKNWFGQKLRGKQETDHG